MSAAWESRLSRRELVRAGAAALVSAPLVRAAGAAAARDGVASAALPAPSRSGIDHVVIVMMENRSFDHLLGWLRGADGKQARLTYLDANGVSHATYRLAPDFQGCGHPDPDHSYDGGRVEYANGACDGFLRSGRNDAYAIGYYTRRDLAFLGPAASYWTVCDRYFAAIMAPTFPNRLYLHAGVTDRLSDAMTPSTLPTIWDRLAEKGVAARNYFSDIPTLLLWGARYSGILRPLADFYADCKRGKLPHVAVIDPPFAGPDGTSSDDHPHADIRRGEAFLARIYAAVTSSAAWPRTVLVITYDEWGGFFDHVPPSEAPDVDPRFALRGFRVPCLVVSPFARRRHVAHTVFDHTSILRLIEWRWNLEPLSVRDAHANNIASVLDFTRRNLKAPRIKTPQVRGRACTPARF